MKMFARTIPVAFILILPAGFSLGRAEEGWTLSGRVLDAESGAPVQEAVVLLIPGAHVVVTAADGRFSFVSPLSQPCHVQVQHVAYETSSFGPFVAESGAAITVELRLDRALRTETVVVKASPAAPASDLTREDAVRTAGTFGDPARALTVLPGVANVSDYKADLRLKGGEPDEVIYRLDGVNIANPYHFRWTRASAAALNMDAFDNLTVRTAGLPVEVGDTISGVIDLSPAERGVGGRAVDVSVGTLASSLTGVGPVGEAGSWIAAGRYSNLELYRSLYHTDQLGVPAYADLLLRTRVPLSPEVDLVAGGLALKNDLTTSGTGHQDSKDLHAASGTAYVGLDKSLEDGARLSMRLASEGSRQDADTDEGSHLRSRERGLRLSIEGEKDAGTGHRWKVGAEGARLAGTIAGVVEQAPDLRPLDARSMRGGVYASGGLDLSPEWSVEAGLRTDWDSRFGATTLQPRLRAEYAAPSGWRARLAASRYSEYPRFEQEFLAPRETLGVTRADELSAGAVFPLARGLLTEVQAYTQTMRDVVAEVVNLYPDVPEPTGRFERGRLDGLELALREEEGRLTSRLAVTLLRGHLTRDGVETRRSGDQPYRLDDSIACSLRTGWQLVTRLQAASGLPYSSYEPLGDGGRVVGSLNGRRLPSYARLDLRAQWEGRLRGARARVYFEVDNALSRKNVRGRELEWDPDRNSYVTRDELSMPMVPGFGIDLSWGS